MLAEQCNRFDEMVQFLEDMLKSREKDLSNDERNLIFFPLPTRIPSLPEEPPSVPSLPMRPRKKRRKQAPSFPSFKSTTKKSKMSSTRPVKMS